MKQIIITGGDGFIGKRVCERLKQNKDYNLIILKEEEFDIRKPESFENLTCDYFIHMAALIRNEHPQKMMDVNVKGTFNVLEFCKRVGAKLIFTSSCGVYGNSHSPIKEDSPLAPVNYNGLTKLLGEQLCNYYSINHNVCSIILRIFNPYGPGQREGFLITDIIKQLKNEKIILKSPYPKRDYVHIDDVAEAIEKSLQVNISEIFNIGTGIGTSVKELVKMITDKPVIFENETLIEDDIHADISKAEISLNWKPKIQLNEGLQRI